LKFHVAQMLIGSVLIAAVALLSPASAEVAASCSRGTRGMSPGCPSKLDYLVLASFADYSNMLAMSTYRVPKTANAPIDSVPAAVDAKSPSADE
jgi:hypothetical protein